MTTCTSELLERGMQIMAEMGLEQCRDEVAQFNSDRKLRAVCALGAMVLGAGITIDREVLTGDAIQWIAEVCPTANITETDVLSRNSVRLTIIWAIPRMNDGSPASGLAAHTLPEILERIKVWEQAASS